MAQKLSDKTIREINKFPRELSNGQIAEKLGIHIDTVLKYRDKTKKEIVDNFSKDDKKKLEILKNLNPKQIQEILHLNTIASKTDKINIVTEEIGHALFGAMGDTHMGSKVHNLDGLHKYYDKLQERGVKTVFHAGDLVDGYNVYKGHAFELAQHGADAQAEYVVKNYPKRDGMETHFIGGNHCESLLQLAGYDIGKYVDKMRDDMHYHGFYNARIMLNGIDIELQHGGGGNSYAWSYKLQKYLENADPKNQPNVFLLGHYHSAIYVFYRKIHAFMVGAFQGETNLTKRFKLGNTMGGWIVEVTLDNQGGTTINIEFISVNK